MPITQIPFQDPVAPPEKPQPEQLGLYDTKEWETAYRDLDDDARVPHLLIQLQDDLARSRRREAAWISIIVHLILIVLIANIERFDKYLPWHSAVPVKNATSGKDVTFLELPPDLQKVPHRPNTNIASDKDRVAMTRHPQLDIKELRKSLATPPPGMPGTRAPQIEQPPAQSSAGLAPSQTPPQAQQPPNPQIAQLQTPATPNINNEFKKYAGSMSAGSAIQEAARGAAARRAGGQQGNGGDFGLRTGARGRQEGNLEILSDTMGVDFGPYLQRVLQNVRENWYRLIPESAQMKKGKLALEFAIMKDGSVRGLGITQGSGDVTLDRPAYGSITASDPFPPLPAEFKGEFLSLRFRFYYNPDKGELEQ
ncbi:MAG TPA: TonB C-terminal domain-containing protein [Candidatus Sulfotelmatobacter sp.]|jgi:outer membrane biosynthesis protein TonB|nr:TonB C-terminal domain-containing protein [Candidatus Sulfotelmatobacter sp.]